jgi:predicted RNA-binding protein associated with RNAse of E/G family
MLQRPSEMYAVWVFWEGPDRAFDCWYVNIQEPFCRTDVGYDTQDLELDIIVRADGSWALKDDDVLEQRIAEGRFTSEQIADVRDEARRITRDLEAGIRWWSDEWAAWEPDTSWSVPRFP